LDVDRALLNEDVERTLLTMPLSPPLPFGASSCSFPPPLTIRLTKLEGVVFSRAILLCVPGELSFSHRDRARLLSTEFSGGIIVDDRGSRVCVFIGSSLTGDASLRLRRLPVGDGVPTPLTILLTKLDGVVFSRAILLCVPGLRPPSSTPPTFRSLLFGVLPSTRFVVLFPKLLLLTIRRAKVRGVGFSICPFSICPASPFPAD
jgi:hypothetical protein